MPHRWPPIASPADSFVIHTELGTAADLVRLLALVADAYELQPLFASGLASDKLADLERSRARGARERLAVACGPYARAQR